MATLSSLLGSSFKGDGFTFYSTFNSGATYNKNDVVQYNGSAYVGIQNNISTGTAPSTDTSNWALFVSKGDTGSAGSGVSTGKAIAMAIVFG